MNPTPRSKYVDGNAASAIGYDIVQLKYDGWYCRMVSLHGAQVYFSDTDRIFHTTDHLMPDCELIGEFMRGTQWSKHESRHGKFFLYDALALPVGPLDKMVYAARYRLLRRFAPQFPDTFQLALCFSMAHRDEVWRSYVETEGFEGLVYRKSTDLLGATLIRDKRVFTLDGQIVGFVEGQGKHAGRLGALDVKLPSGVVTSVGNGLDDATREHIWYNRESHLGRWLEFETNAVFQSGNVRHGRFVRWREDKT